MGLFEQIAEDARAADAAFAGGGRLGPDDRYWKTMSYAFHLHLPTRSAPIVFPLVLNPTSIQKRHPFSAELTPAQEGGVVGEEAGVIISDLTIQGNTGFAPTFSLGSRDAALTSVPLSGQAHFLHLQDQLFLRYSDLKNDPKYGKDTFVTFHNYKDSEHWIVVPRDLRLERSRDKNFLYGYTIQVSIVGAYENRRKAAVEDDGVLKDIADAAAAIRVGVAQIQAAMVDLVGAENVQLAGVLPEVVDSVGASITSALTEVTHIAGAASEFLRGTKATIALPVRALDTAAEKLDQLLVPLTRAANLPPDVVQIVRDIQDGIFRLATYPAKFKEPFDVAAQRFLDLAKGPARADPSALDAAATGSVTQAQQLATSAIRPGDKQRVEAGVYRTNRTFPRYTGFREIAISHGDTLPALAARELGDARRWIDLAIANQLAAPYISEEGLPGTARPGQRLLVPTTDTATQVQQVRSAGDPAQGASQLETVFGRDLEIEQYADGTYDYVVDDVHGSTDVRTVAGPANLAQATTVILSTERGTNVLYRDVGYDRLVGRRGTVERIVEARSRIVEAIQRDPRVRRVSGVSFAAHADSVEVAVEVVAADASPHRVVGRIIS